MAPAGDRVFHVICENQFEGDLSADASGHHCVSVCLQQSLVLRSGRFRGFCFDQYHWLREYMMEHPEVEAILGATD